MMIYGTSIGIYIYMTEPILLPYMEHIFFCGAGGQLVLSGKPTWLDGKFCLLVGHTSSNGSCFIGETIYFRKGAAAQGPLISFDLMVEKRSTL